MELNFELIDINNDIKECLSRVAIGVDPIKALIVNDGFVPKESWLWDYKECFNNDAVSLSKTVLQIVSFYNMYGGYIIYGVAEKIKDKEFVPVSLDISKFNSAQLRDLIKKYTDTVIDFTFSEVNVEVGSETFCFGLVHIPRRIHTARPVHFVRNGPEKEPGKPLFNRDESYFRCLDECTKAKTPSDWMTLFSAREFDALYGIDTVSSTNNTRIFSHNLPDRHLICSKFIGREMVLSKLWEWLADEFEYTKILSGDGGKGKTSIAYEFCRSFLSSPPVGYERVLWVTVKKHQFSGFTNTYYDLQGSDFDDSHSFLKCLSENCALDVDEYDELSYKIIRKQLKEALSLFPALIVVDDIDSLEEDEQRKVVDACRHLGADKVRFLITTRKKLAYSSDLCIDVPGFPFDDFSIYVDSIVEQYSLKEITVKEKGRLYSACDGSPLLSSSILRLYKQGMSLQVAIAEWSGQAGEDARNAALKREIEALSHDAKRMLLTIFYFKNCSFTELRQAAGLEKIKMVDCLEELQSLFLVNEPKIIDSENRFSISNTTALIVETMVKKLAFDYQRLKLSVKKLKEGPSSKKTGNRRRVGLAINQALAFLREERFKEAIETIDIELGSQKANPDLLLMKARCLMSMQLPKFEFARDLLRRSVQAGQRKELAYDLWFKTEAQLESSNGMIECATKALELEDSDKKRWHEEQALGFVMRSKSRSGDSAITDLMDASFALTNTLKDLGQVEKEFRIQELSTLHDFIWKKVESENDLSWLSSFDILMDLINRGDVRSSMFRNARRCLIEAKSEPNFSGNKIIAYEVCVDKFKKVINQRSQKDKRDRPLDGLLDAIG